MDKKILVNDIHGTENNNEYEFSVTINNFLTLRKWIVVGESLTSNEFIMLFPNSIGESKWKLLFYPSGQYVDGKVGSYVSIYLVMLSCEKDDQILTANVTYKLMSDANKDGPMTTLKAEFDYSNTRKRWLGNNWLNSRRCKQFFVNDTLIISCLVSEKIPKHQSKENESKSLDKGIVKDSDIGLLTGLKVCLDDVRNNNNVSQCEVDDVQSDDEGDFIPVRNRKVWKGKNNHRNFVDDVGSSKAKSSVLCNYADKVLF